MDIDEEYQANWDAHKILLDKFYEVFKELSKPSKDYIDFVNHVKYVKALVMLRRACWHVINLKEVYNS